MRRQIPSNRLTDTNYRPSVVVFLAAVSLLLPITAAAQNHSSITFENGAGETALVKLVGPSGRTVSVPKSENRTESGIAPGRYYLVVRYGDVEKDYTYMKGDPFDIEESGNQYTEMSITLYKVVDGNYNTRPASKEEFEKAKSD
jgi:hypothetical protein